jgi:ligand-binding SRPBCC domain-containing protein
MEKIEFSTNIKAPIHRCFDLARSIDFRKISFGDLNEKSVAGCTAGLIGAQQHVLIQSTLGGFRMSTNLKVEKFNPPFFFSYEIVESAFHSIVHDYYFYDISEETVMINHLYYRTRWGLAGNLLNLLFLNSYLKRLVTKRNDLLREYAESDKWKEILPVPEPELAIVC